VITIQVTLDGAEAEIIVRVLEERLRGMFADAVQTSEGRDQMFEVMRPYVHVKDALDDAREVSASAKLVPGDAPVGFGFPGPPLAPPPIPQARGTNVTGVTGVPGYCSRCGGTSSCHRVLDCTG
jgi:hypothetical protein